MGYVGQGFIITIIQGISPPLIPSSQPPPTHNLSPHPLWPNKSAQFVQGKAAAPVGVPKPDDEGPLADVAHVDDKATIDVDKKGTEKKVNFFLTFQESTDRLDESLAPTDI